MFSLGSADPEHVAEPSSNTDQVLESDAMGNVSGTFVEASSTAPSDPSPTLHSSSHFPARSSVSSKLGEDSESLETLGEPFQAVWFTYDYHDVGPQRSVEECTEVLRVGVVCATFSPDVVHRLELFYTAFGESLKVAPSVSIGITVRE